jgi:Na+-translocating ferredoxin:NAD+ oxidoreductase RnfD subunit
MPDPRYYQIAVLSGLAVYGAFALDFEIRPLGAALTLGAALAAQGVCSRLAGVRFDPRSPLISGLSLCLLLRTDLPWLAVAAAVVTIAGKFVIRVEGKHVFNPTNFGLVAMMLATDRVWVSPGQWGSAAFFGFLLACLGGLVIHRAARSDVTYAFLAAYCGVLFGRALWLGDPLTIPLHQLQSGALLIFAFFMISDPKTTPDARAGRVAFAALVALVAGWIQFRLFRPDGLIWALALCAPAVPLIDRLVPGVRYVWQRSRPLYRARRLTVSHPQTVSRSLGVLVLFVLFASPVRAFCGFYVGKADTKLFNQASSVVLVRDGERTVLTMSSDYRGDLKEFALVVPVPTVLEREQIHVGDQAMIDHLDAFTSPRLVEYFDPDPCAVVRYEKELRALGSMADAAAPTAGRNEGLGVTIEARYTVGEYDVLILSATQSDGLETWLRQNGYRIPDGASQVLGSYIRQNLRFFVARVNLEEQARLGYAHLRPLQMAYESRRFMLPIRLGTVNADGPQELFVFALTRTGRVETANYRTVKLPSDIEVPVFVKHEFADFYRDLFAHQVEEERMRTVFLEYAWDMNWCDPCAADPLSDRELRDLGVFWAGDERREGFKQQARDVFVTRLHVRYTAENFPEDLVLQETGDRTNFQGRYVLRHPWKGKATCPAARDYFRQLEQRQEREARTLASLTGWDLDEIRGKMDLPESALTQGEDDRPWWKKIWGSR